MPVYSAQTISRILRTMKTIAVVGASVDTGRPSAFVVRYLIDKGYRVFPVNPLYAGQEIHGRRVYAALSELPEPIDMVDIFRHARYVPQIIDEVLALEVRPKVIWMQLGVVDDVQAERAQAAGMEVIMDRCPKMEYGKLSGEWGWVGGNSGIVSSKKAQTHRRVQSLKLRD